MRSLPERARVMGAMMMRLGSESSPRLSGSNSRLKGMACGTFSWGCELLVCHEPALLCTPPSPCHRLLPLLEPQSGPCTLATHENPVRVPGQHLPLPHRRSHAAPAQ